MKAKSWVVGTIAILALSGFKTSCATEPPISIKIGYRNTSTTDLFLLKTLQNHNLLEKEGIAPEFYEFQKPQEVGLSLMTDRIDASMFVGYEHALLMAGEKKSDWKALAAVVENQNYPHYFLIVRNGDPIHNISDLSGKTVGYFPGTPTMKSHVEILIKHHLLNGVKMVPLGSPTSIIPSLQLRQTDAIITPEPAATLAVLAGVAKIINPVRGLYAEIHGEPYPVLLSMARPGIGRNTAEKLRRAYEKAITIIRQDENQTRQLIISYFNGTENEKRKAATEIHIPYYQTISEFNFTRFEHVYDELKRMNFFKHNVDLNSLLR